MGRRKDCFPPLLCFPVSAMLCLAAGRQGPAEGERMKVEVYTNPG